MKFFWGVNPHSNVRIHRLRGINDGMAPVSDLTHSQMRDHRLLSTNSVIFLSTDLIRDTIRRSPRDEV